MLFSWCCFFSPLSNISRILDFHFQIVDLLMYVMMTNADYLAISRTDNKNENSIRFDYQNKQNATVYKRI
jgi:hypothetical protein